MKTVFMNFPSFGSIKINGVFTKGKRGKDKRLCITELSSNTDYILWLEDHPISGKRVEFTNVTKLPDGNLKQQNYNYYPDTSINEDAFFDQMITDFLDSDPMVPKTLTSIIHTKYSKSSKYPIYY